MLPEGRLRSYLSSLKVVLAAESATLKMKARPCRAAHFSTSVPTVLC